MVSFTIPTLNSSGTLAMSLDSIREQLLEEEREIIVVDGGSDDGTIEIAESNGALVISDPGKLLGARRRGIERSRGHVVVLLDSDQILRPGSIGAACELLRAGYDMVALGERVYLPRSLTDRLSDLDKQLLERDIASQLDPLTGVILPRVFRRELLERAFSQIPRTLDDVVVAHDHAIIYFECSKLSSHAGYAPEAVWHVEPHNVISLWRKNFRYGWTTRRLIRSGKYADLIRRKTRMRTIKRVGALRLRLASFAFLSVKAIAYMGGYAFGARFRSER
jgi:glycosyltransferase involved in cell wall biosynthesis